MVRIQRLIFVLTILTFTACGDTDQGSVTTIPEKVEVIHGFIRSEQLEQLASEGRTIVYFDVRKPEHYQRGHIPGAVQVYRPDIQRDDLPYPGVAISSRAFEHLLDSLGVHQEDWIVAYDDKGGSDAARFCWLARRYGHPHAAVLDGGLNLYLSMHQADTNLTIRTPSGYRFPGWEEPNFVATLDDVIEALNDTTVILLDTRSYDEFSGKFMKPGAVRAGHIPGSIWFDWGNCVRMDSDFRIKEVVDLEHMLNAVGVTKEHQIITYCHTGVRSSHTMTVLRDVLGYPNVRNYDGSWCEWSYMQELPIAVVEEGL